MKSLSQQITEGMVNEASEFNPSLSSHKNVWNNFIKWYDKSLKYMDKYELLDLLKSATIDIENDDLTEYK